MIELIIVCGTFLRVGKHFVRLVDLFEFCRGVCVVRVQVGMVLFDELAVSRFDLFVRRLSADAQDVVIILFIGHILIPYPEILFAPAEIPPICGQNGDLMRIPRKRTAMP